MVFLILITMTSMVLNFKVFSNNYLLLTLSAVTFALAVWLILEAILIYRKERNKI